MNYIDSTVLDAAKREAIFNLYLYLAPISPPAIGEKLYDAVKKLKNHSKKYPDSLSEGDIANINIINFALNENSSLSHSTFSELTYSQSGLTACALKSPEGEISAVFRGTGSGEWLDNGEGLSGIPQKNTYFFYKGGRAVKKYTVTEDYATDRQVEALNWFRYIVSKNGWDKNTRITVSGHSKGGNKAQFIAAHSDLINDCFSFDGQGFSPEAIQALRQKYGDDFNERCSKIFSLSADNDYVNVLGERLMPEQNIYFFESFSGLHPMEAILDSTGRLRPQTEQGRLSKYVEEVSERLMSTNPLIRQYITNGVMKVLGNYLAKHDANRESFSPEQTVSSISEKIEAFIREI